MWFDLSKTTFNSEFKVSDSTAFSIKSQAAISPFYELDASYHSEIYHRLVRAKVANAGFREKRRSLIFMQIEFFID